MYKRSSIGWAKHWDFILLDTLCLQIAYMLAYAYRFGYDRFVYRHDDYKGVGLLLALFSCFVAVFFNTMHNVLRRGIGEELQKTLEQCILVFGAIVVFLFSTKDSNTVSRIVLYITLGVYLVLSLVVRLLYKDFITKNRLAGKSREMLLISDKANAAKTINKINSRPEENINISGVILVDPNRKNGNNKENVEIAGVPVVAKLQEASDYILYKWIDEVYIAVSDYTSIPKELIDNCEEMAVTIHQKLIPKISSNGRQIIEKIAREPVLTSSVTIAKPWQVMVKRGIDIIAGIFISLLALIVLSIVGPIIKKESPGPLLLKHERIGQNGKKFMMYTIRAMYLDAGARIQEWREKHPGEELTVVRDPRFIGNKDENTGIGLFIRRWSLGALPKGFNILLGQMSLVGTRAPSVEEWEQYEFRHRARLACKPGLTGMWQASGRSKEMDFEEATELDTEYITNWSLWLDFKILFKVLTVRHH